MNKSLIFILILFFPVWVKAQTVRIIVPGKGLVYNGVSKVPEGLMGVHLGGFTNYSDSLAKDWGIRTVRRIETSPSGNISNGSTTVPISITCWYDRYVPAPFITNPSGWKGILQTYATTMAQNALTANKPAYLEFYNEPYLNWAYKPGVNTDPQYFSAPNQAGDSVKLKGQTQNLPYLTWQPGIWFTANWASNTSNLYVSIANTWNTRMAALGIPYPGLNGVLNPGEVYNPGTRLEFTVVNALRPTDPTQHSFYSGAFNGFVYRQMFSEVANTIKAIKPDFNTIGGFGFEPHIDNWSPWQTLFKPLIDENHFQMDGIHEHHYGMDTRIVAADYETMYAYAFNRFGKKLNFYNTETGGYLDPQRGANSSAYGSNKAKAMQAFTYHLADIIYMTSFLPDKPVSRAIHEPQNSFTGAENALKILKGLSGNLLYTESESEEVWTVASLSADTVLFIAAFNHSDQIKNIKLTANAPVGLNFVSCNRFTPDTTNGTTTNPFINWQNVNIGTYPDSVLDSLSLNPKQAAIYYLIVQGNSSSNPAVALNQYFADSVLQTIAAGQTGTWNINLAGVNWQNIGAARLKMALFNANTSPVLLVNNQPISFTYRGGISHNNEGGLSFANIPVSVIGNNQSASLAIATSGDSAQLWSASLELSSEPRILGNKPNSPLKADLQLFPNPSIDWIEVKNLEKQTKAQILNNLGQDLGSIHFIPGKRTQFPPLPTGLYILKINGQGLKMAIY